MQTLCCRRARRGPVKDAAYFGRLARSNMRIAHARLGRLIDTARWLQEELRAAERTPDTSAAALVAWSAAMDLRALDVLIRLEPEEIQRFAERIAGRHRAQTENDAKQRTWPGGQRAGIAS